jgi:hypothetical protein
MADLRDHRNHRPAVFARRRRGVGLALALILLAGCRWIDARPTLVPTLPSPPGLGTSTPQANATDDLSLTAIFPGSTSTATPLPPTPTPTPTLTPTPTATPIPPVQLTIEFPRPVDALEPVAFRVLIEEPPGVQANVRLAAHVIDAEDQLYDTFEMVPQGREGWWVPTKLLQLPLEPEPYPGVWHLIIDAESDLRIKGYKDRVFTPQRVPYHVVTGTLPSGVELRVPQAFGLTRAGGDLNAGRRAWNYRDCEISLAWAPGPTEPLLPDNARVMLEATFDPAFEIRVESSTEVVLGSEDTEQWSGFLFQESWLAENKRTPAETLVVQGPDFRLYALRTRTLTEDQIHPLCHDVADTFGFKTEE